MDGEIKVKVVVCEGASLEEVAAFVDTLRKEVEERGGLVSTREISAGRVCRGCGNFDKDRCRLLFAWQDPSTGASELYRYDEPCNDGYLKIYDPDDFGCNKWEAKP